MPIDYSRFDNIGDSDDEDVKAKAPASPAPSPKAGKESPKAAPAPTPVAVSEEHAKPLDDAPTLELPEGDWLKYYQNNMTAPQRMQTLVHLWNSADQDERVAFLRHLIDIIGNPTISNRIKGGQEILKDLDTSFYKGVTYPEKWIELFQEKAVDDKKVVFEKLFKSLDSQERGLVLGTLM